MNRLLLSLWLLGAALYAGNTLLYTNAIFGWPKQKVAADAPKETVKPKAETPIQDRQPAEIAESQRTAAPSPTPGEPNPIPAPQPQGKHAPGLDTAATAPLPPMSQGQLTPGLSAQQQIQSAPPAQQNGDASSSQAANPSSSPAVSNESPSQTTPAPPTQQAQSTPQPEPEKGASATEAPSAELEQQSVEWAKVSGGGATVRSGPSSSASELSNLSSGMEVKVVGRESGWVQIASSDGSKTGWVYEKLLEPTGIPSGQGAAPDIPAHAANEVEQPQRQSGWVKVLGSPAGMRSSPSQSAPILFAFPEGRELRVVSRQPGWVQVTDPGSKQSGWVADASLVASDGKAKQQQAGAPVQSQQGTSAPARRQQAASAPRQRRQSSPSPQRPSRDAGPETYYSAEGPPLPPRAGWMPRDAEMGPPEAVEQFQDRPRRWRRGGFSFFDRGSGED